MDKTLSMSFDYTGNVWMTTDGYGHVATKVMDENKNYVVPKSATGGSLRSTFSWNGYMALTSAVGPNTDTAGFSYDAIARPSQTAAANGQVTTYGYGTAIPYVTTASTGTRWTKTTMDGFGRPVKVEAGYPKNGSWQPR